LKKTAKLYHSQNLAFQDVLMKEGFEPTQNVARDYDGRIACLTYYSTFMILGKLRENGRHITMSRAHSIDSTLNCDGCRGNLKNDLKIGEIISLGLHDHPNYKGSPLRGLAINPRGADGDELETHTQILASIGHKTCLYIDELERGKQPARDIQL